MFSAADLIDALRRRGRKSLRPELPPGEFPPGWAQWFVAIGERIGRVTGATADAIIAVFLQREPALPPRSTTDLNRWQAFATLWRQQWQPPETEERRVRLVAIAITVLVHIVLLVLLLWLAYVRFTAAPAPAGEEVVQVEFIGQGTPLEQGGGPPNAAPTPPAPAARVVPRTPTNPAAASAVAPPTQPETPTPTPPSPTPEASASAAAEQPLQVSEKPVAEAAFALPPPTPRVVELPQAQASEAKLQAPVRDIELVQAPPPVRVLAPKLPEVTRTAPQLRTTPTPIEVVQPLPAVTPRQVAEQPISTPTPALRQAPTAVPLREQPPSPAPSSAPAAPSAAAAAAPSAAAASTAAAQNAAPAPNQASSARNGTQPTATSSGRGPATTAKPGAWPTPQRGDDWGASTRERPGGNAGGKPGLLNADGTPKLGAGTAEAGAGHPPGSDKWTMDQIDHAGTWLKRPSNDYQPTRFDNVWVPNETLLEQWVRQNIREVSIPIPGTTKKLHCVVSLLQLGGGCGITDPNMQDQEAIARPPPDVPFKPDLQEDQDSLRKPASP